MTYLILIAVSFILLGGFLVLVAFERSQGLRVMGGWRNRLDKHVARITFVARHVDWGAFVRHLLGTVLERFLHDAAHAVLRFVRTMERFLTRAVKGLRERRGMPAPEGDGEETTGAFSAGMEKVRAALRSARQASRKPAKKRSLPEEAA
ncbi:MAG: hypothetical protein V4644_00555 [Patescibacteria group bacterium]